MTKITSQAAAPMWAAYDDIAVWGTGPSAAAAIADVAQWVNPEDAARLQASCGTAIMTPELAKQVERGGAASGHGLLPDNRLGTLAQWEDEHNPPMPDGV